MAALAVYALVWYWPNHVELSRVNTYYLRHQLIPHSLRQLRHNVVEGVSGDARGLVGYLARYSPIQFLLALLAVSGWRGLLLESSWPAEKALTRFLRGWLLTLWAVFAVVNYAPSRYYVLFYPAMAILAAQSLEALWSRPPTLRLLSSLRLAPILLALWASVNVYWTSDWLRHLTCRQRDADRWLAQNLPANAVLIGAVAPGLCLNNHFRCVSVIEHLCNDDRPVERFAPAPRYVLIIDDKTPALRWKERWWARNYPQLVEPSRRLHTFPNVLRPFFVIGLYPVPDALARP